MSEDDDIIRGLAVEREDVMSVLNSALVDVDPKSSLLETARLLVKQINDEAVSWRDIVLKDGSEILRLTTELQAAEARATTAERELTERFAEGLAAYLAERTILDKLPPR